MLGTFEGAIGIDLGTTFSCVAVFLHNSVDVIPNDQGNRTTPSRIAFHNDQLLVGDAALSLSARGVPGVLYDAKRLIGRQFHDKEVQEDAKSWPFEVVPTAAGDRAAIKVAHKGETLVLEPQQVSAHLLVYLKQCAERHLGKAVKRAVITVPAYFTDAQRQATRDAGAIAGLEVLRIINEPTAAALCYGLGVGTALGVQGTDAAKNVLVFDFGGGTFDVSIITVDNGAFEVRSTAGDTHLGGQDIDQNLLAFFIADANQRHHVDFSKNTKVKAKLRAIAEKAKRALSHSTQEEIACDGIINGADYEVQLSRAKFDEINVTVYKRCMTMIQRALTDAKMQPSDIDDIVMVGGSSRIPKIRSMVSEFFKGKSLCTGVNPDEAIAIGAAIQASILSTDASQKSDRTAGVVLMDVVSLSIGLDVDEGHFDILIPRNTTIPYTVTKEFSTTYTNQTDVDIEVFEGERPLTKHNHKLGSFTLEGISKGRKGVPTIVVTLSIDANGCLTVTATETKSNRTKDLVVECKERLSTDDVNRMIEEAAKLRSTDKSEAEFLLKTQDAVRALEDLAAQQAEVGSHLSSRKLEKLSARCAFVDPAMRWLSDKAHTETADVLDAKLQKIWLLHHKASKTTSKLLEASKKKETRRKRKRDDDDDDDNDDEGDDDDDGADEEEEGSAASDDDDDE